jgi:hypothetical protein
MKIHKALAFCLTVLAGGEAIASVDNYSCTVKYVGAVGDDGRIRSVSQSHNDRLRHYLGTEFRVDRRSGSVTGNIISNIGNGVVKTEVIDRGDRMQSFKVLSMFGPESSILYLQINDFPLGLTSDKQITFIGFRWEESISGICKRL